MFEKEHKFYIKDVRLSQVKKLFLSIIQHLNTIIWHFKFFSINFDVACSFVYSECAFESSLLLQYKILERLVTLISHV